MLEGVTQVSKKIAVVGTGAAGTYIGAFLSREGHDVTLFDMWGEHVEVMRTSGISVTGCQGPFSVSVNAYHLADAMQVNSLFDIIFFAVKSYDTEWTAHFAKRLLKDDGVLVDNQNCMNDAKIAEIVGYNRTVGCVMSSITVGLWAPGIVDRGGKPGYESGHDVFRVGELHGRVTKRVDEIVDLLSIIDGAKSTTNLSLIHI